MSGGKSSLRGGKKMLTGGWSRPLPTSGGRTLLLAHVCEVIMRIQSLQIEEIVQRQ